MVYSTFSPLNLNDRQVLREAHPPRAHAKPSVTRAVQKLMAMGLLTMRTDPNDYRMVKIYVAENAK